MNQAFSDNDILSCSVNIRTKLALKRQFLNVKAIFEGCIFHLRGGQYISEDQKSCRELKRSAEMPGKEFCPGKRTEKTKTPPQKKKKTKKKKKKKKKKGPPGRGGEGQKKKKKKKLLKDLIKKSQQ
ncbi:MAG: hypothetical protein IPI23_12905 [Bacteroidetes bacterium]|nr:hypothetical protein [Bacteroidota bacterium]